MALADGEYTIEVTLTGGSGRAYVKSPTNLMKVGEREYTPVNTEGNSAFLIEVDALDSDIPVKAETVAMSRPHMIDYTLRFDSSTAKPVGGVSYTLLFSLIGAAALIAGGAALLRRRGSR